MGNVGWRGLPLHCTPHYSVSATTLINLNKWLRPGACPEGGPGVPLVTPSQNDVFTLWFSQCPGFLGHYLVGLLMLAKTSFAVFIYFSHPHKAYGNNIKACIQLFSMFEMAIFSQQKFCHHRTFTALVLQL